MCTLLLRQQRFPNVWSTLFRLFPFFLSFCLSLTLDRLGDQFLFSESTLDLPRVSSDQATGLVSFSTFWFLLFVLWIQSFSLFSLFLSLFPFSLSLFSLILWDSENLYWYRGFCISWKSWLLQFLKMVQRYNHVKCPFFDCRWSPSDWKERIYLMTFKQIRIQGF